MSDKKGVAEHKRSANELIDLLKQAETLRTGEDGGDSSASSNQLQTKSSTNPLLTSQPQDSSQGAENAKNGKKGKAGAKIIEVGEEAPSDKKTKGQTKHAPLLVAE